MTSGTVDADATAAARIKSPALGSGPISTYLVSGDAQPSSYSPGDTKRSYTTCFFEESIGTCLIRNKARLTEYFVAAGLKRFRNWFNGQGARRVKEKKNEGGDRRRFLSFSIFLQGTRDYHQPRPELAIIVYISVRQQWIPPNNRTAGYLQRSRKTDKFQASTTSKQPCKVSMARSTQKKVDQVRKNMSSA